MYNAHFIWCNGEIYGEGIFVFFPDDKNAKSSSNFSPFLNDRHFQTWLQKTKQKQKNKNKTKTKKQKQTNKNQTKQNKTKNKPKQLHFQKKII